jgi:hypothetical protein
MDTYEDAHFAWDLLASAKRATVPQSAPEQPVQELAAPKPPALDASLTAASNPPAAIVPPAPPPATAQQFTGPVPSLDEASSRGCARLSPYLAELRRQPSTVGSNGDIPKLNWVDLGRSTEPGQYESRYGLVELRAEDLSIWKLYPHATFALMPPSPLSEKSVSRLGSFDLGDQGNARNDKE